MPKPPIHVSFLAAEQQTFSLKYRLIFFQSVCDSSGLNYLCTRNFQSDNQTIMNMGIIDSKTTYKAPQTKVIEVKVQGVLCGSPYGENTEKFGMSGHSYDEDDWE